MISGSAAGKRCGAIFGAGVSRSHLFLRLCVLVLSWAVIGSSQVWAQINTATLSGTVVDSSGAAIPGASVLVVETATGSRRTAQTNAQGLFAIPSLQPSSYDLTVSKSGFETSKQSNIVLEINQSASLSVSLKVGSAETTVQVTSAAPLLDTQTSSLGSVVEQKEIVDLPLNGRQFTQLLQLTPGTVPIDVSQNSGTRPDLGGGGVTPAINGQSNRSDLFFIDGVYATDPFFSGYSISPSIDAIQEFQEQTHADQAEFGQSTGGTINLSTRAGTNVFHGSAYEFLRNNDFDANNYFWTHGTPNGYHQNQFGGTFGGPILHDKLFFFGLYDGYRSAKAAVQFSTLPTAAELGGDFSAVASNTIIYDPATYNAASGAATPFPNNIIPSGRLNQGVLTALKAFLPANLPTATTPNNFVNTSSGLISQDQYGGRIDYNVTPKDILFGRYTVNIESQTSPQALPINPFATTFNGQNGGITWTRTYSATLLSQITVGYNSIDFGQEQTQPNAASVFQASGFNEGFTDTPGGIKLPMVPGLHPSGFFDLNSGWGPIGPQRTGQLSGSVSKQAGPHALKFGASGYINAMYTNWAEDDINFNNQATWNPATQGGGNSLASLLLGLPDGSSRQLGNSGVSLRSRLAGLFAEDSWKVSRKLTLNYGLRWDYTSPVTDIHNRLSGFDIHTGDWYIAKGSVDTPTYSLPAGVVILNRNSITKPDYKEFSPRLGFSYSPMPKTAIRAGVGVSFDDWSGALQAAQNARGGWPDGASQSVSNQNIAGITPGATAQNPFGTLAPVVPTTPFPSGGGFLDTQFKNAYSWQWNLQIQQEVGSSGVFSLGYVGSSTSRAPIQVPQNQSLVLGPTQAIPFTNMSNFATLESIGHMNYNSLQTKYEKRFHDGISFTTAFTWSKTINIGCAEFWEDCNIQNAYDLRPDRSASDTDVPLIFTVSSVYELPFGKGKQFVQDGVPALLLGGWQLNGIVAARNGTPYTVTINFDNANANEGYGTQRPSLVPNASTIGPHTVSEYFNTAAFTVAPQYTFGDVHRNSLRGPGYTDADVSIFRNFSLFEKSTLQFRSEFFNVLNHPNFSNPDSGLQDQAYGKLDSTSGNQRQIQFALKLNF
jgi:hypothetical protein